MRREKRLALSSVRLRVCAKLLTVLTTVVTMTYALFLSGCATRRSTVTAEESAAISSLCTEHALHLSLDSASEVVEIRTERLTVPMSKVSLTIATDSLRSLPNGASYSERSGQASIKLTRLPATSTTPERIYVYASCDSLELQCERYERQIRNLRSEYSELQSEMQSHLATTASQHTEQLEKPPNGIVRALKWFFIGLVSGILCTIVFRFLITN